MSVYSNLPIRFELDWDLYSQTYVKELYNPITKFPRLSLLTLLFSHSSLKQKWLSIPLWFYSNLIWSLERFSAICEKCVLFKLKERWDHFVILTFSLRKDFHIHPTKTFSFFHQTRKTRNYLLVWCKRKQREDISF